MEMEIQIISRSDMKLGKIFSTSEKNIFLSILSRLYTIFRFPGGVAKKWGKLCIIILWRKIFVLKIGPELMAVVDELLRRKQSKDPQAGNGELSLED